MVCEADEFETCSNCSTDCGACQTQGCGQVLACAFRCFDFGGGGFPNVSVSCVANCVALGCPNVQFFVDQFFGCALDNIGECDSISCIMRECREEAQACLMATCP
jgi:hypothetical protein